MMTETLANIHMNKQHQQQQQQQKKPSMPKLNSTVSMFQTRHQEDVKRSGSFVVGQKLRESKWFPREEGNIFCAVVESGFIVEHKGEEGIRHGVALWTPTFEKSKNPDYLTIYTMQEQKGKHKIISCKLNEFWPDGTVVRINNKSDKTESPLEEDAIRNQILAAEHLRRKWHNSEHFAYFCRYGPVPNNMRMRKMTDHIRWNATTFFLKIRSLTAK